MVGKFGEFGESSMICQTKLVLTIYNLLTDLLIRQTFFRQMLKSVNLPIFPHQTFQLYSNWLLFNDYPPVWLDNICYSNFLQTDTRLGIPYSGKVWWGESLAN